MTNTRAQSTPKAMSVVVRETALRGVLTLALSASSFGTFVGNAYAQKLDGEDSSIKRMRAENDKAARDPLSVAAISRECPLILADPADYDDALIALCLKEWRRR